MDSTASSQDRLDCWRYTGTPTLNSGGGGGGGGGCGAVTCAAVGDGVGTAGSRRAVSRTQEPATRSALAGTGDTIRSPVSGAYRTTPTPWTPSQRPSESVYGSP